MKWIMLCCVSVLPATKDEFDKIYLVNPKNVTKGIQVSRSSKQPTGVQREFYRAETKFGRYIRLDNLIIADGPDKKRHFFMYDLKSGKVVEATDMLFDPTAPGNDKRMLLPASCQRCH